MIWTIFEVLTSAAQAIMDELDDNRPKFSIFGFFSTPSSLTGDGKEEKGVILTQVHTFVDVLITAIF